MPDVVTPLQPTSAPAGTRQPGTARTRTRLIKAAQDALIEGGGAAEIGAIAERAGVSAGLAYHHFGSKDGLIAAVVEDFYARYQAIATARYNGESWAEREI